MKQAVVIGSILVIVIGAAVAIYLSRRKDDDPTGLELPEQNCHKINHGAWGRWNNDAIPGGLLGELARKYFSGKTEDEYSAIGSTIAGWFKGVDAYPRATMANAYKKEIIAYVNSRDAAPHWLVNVGELEC
jgi:hypothetical protein